jgi:flagellar hook protein FlgE
MFQALFNSLSGLFSFSRSLDTVSDNVANMNTPGFKGRDSFFANIGGGRGTTIAGDGLRTRAGDLRQTGNPTDLAVDGEGWFILRDPSGNLHYTRAGQFRFDGDGMLVDGVTGFQVMALDAGNNLVAIDFDDYRSIAAEATTRINIKGNIAPGATSPVAVNSVTVYDANGTAHVLSVSFANKNTTPASFDVTVSDADGTVLQTGEVRFDSAGMPQAGHSDMTLALTFGGVPQSVTLGFGTAGAPDGMTALTGVPSSLSSQVTDGHGVLTATDVSFDDKGVLQLAYSASEKRQGPQVALARFANEGQLKLAGGRLLAGAVDSQREIGRPGDGQFGAIAGGSLELSNVDLTQEFADMIIIQRGYQASSRVMTVSNEMLEQLYNSTRGG